MDMPPISALKTHWLLDGESSKKPTLFTNRAHMRLLSDEERREEERYNVSTKPTLFTDRWTMKTKLTNNNLGHESCLPLSNTFVDDHILICFPEDDKRKVKEGSELTVNVYDHDTDSMHQFLLRYWPKGQCYALFNGWPLDFFYRRALKEDDTIGLYWDRTDLKLHFCVLSPTPMEVTSEPLNFARMRLLSDNKIREKKRYNVSTKPTLFTDRWTIKTKLTNSNLGHESCLPLSNKFVDDNILICFPENDKRKVKEGSELTINVYDHDTDSMHQFLLRYWPKGQCYALFNGWPLDFFYRRALREDNTIGIYWDRTDFKLHFSVLSPTPMEVTSVQLNLARMRLLSDKERREKKRYNISTKPTLFTDWWTIKKKLTKSHVGHKSCFPLSENNNNFVKKHILTCFLKDDERKVEERSRSVVNVYDHDTDSMHRLLLSYWSKGRCYALQNGWPLNFAHRRNLRIDDKVELYWDSSDFMFHFCVLSRAQ